MTSRSLPTGICTRATAIGYGRFDATTGTFIDNFVLPANGELSDGRYFIFRPDGVIPEPGMLLLVGSGLLGLACLLRKAKGYRAKTWRINLLRKEQPVMLTDLGSLFR